MAKPDEHKDKDLKRLERKLAREIKAREEAERLLEEKSAELYALTRRTQDLATNIQTAERDAMIISLGQSIAHDLNNLITAISGYAMLLQNDVQPGSESFKRVERIGRAAEQAAGVVGSLDHITAQTLKITSINLSELAEINVQIAEGFRPDGIRFNVSIEPDLKITNHDIAISRSLINILKNAFEAISDKGHVSLSTTKLPNINKIQYAHQITFGEPGDIYEAVIEIVDDGVGMDMPTLESAFHRSFSTKDGGGLHGLGLQSVNTLADHDLAFVTAESEPQKGTRLCLYLKVPVQAEKDMDDPTPVKKSNGAIFIIDDDPLVGDMLQATLTQMGHEAFWYEYPLQALKDLHHNPPALIITDFNMPEMSGREFAEQAHDIQPTVPIIVYSGQAALIPKNPIYSAILKKPITVDKLQNVIESLIIT